MKTQKKLELRREIKRLISQGYSKRKIVMILKAFEFNELLIEKHYDEIKGDKK
jgi:hypothetical protein